MHRKNLIAALFLLVVSVWYGFLTSGLPARTLPNTPDPSFFPWIITIMLAVLALALLGQAVFLRDGEAPKPAAERATPFLFLVVFVVYSALLPYFGFLVASIPFFLILMMLFGERRKTWIAAFSIGIPVFLQILFRNVFEIPLPRGALSGLIG